MSRFIKRFALLILVGMIASSTFGDSVTLTASGDTHLFEPAPDNNAGGNPTFIAGANFNLKRSRGLVKFDLAGQIPANASIQSVSLTLTVTMVPATPTDSTFDLHRVLVDWGEGTGSSASGDAGRLAVAGEATWNHRFHPSTSWSVVGAAAPGDFSSTVSASQFVHLEGAYTFGSTPALVADVEQWLADPSTNFGWIVISESEATTGTHRSFASRESSANNGPTLVVQYVIPKLGNISTRGFVQTGDNVMIGGFIIQGTQAKKVMLRALGPVLTQFGISNALSDPKLELHDSTQALIGRNDDWQTTQIGGVITSDQVSDIQNSGKAPTEDKESAIIATLDPGAYTVIINGANNATGVGLVEAYDLDLTADSKLSNISTRGFVQTGDNVMIGGFIIQGTQAKKVMLRALGPVLTQFGISNALSDPKLELHDSTQALIGRNDDWQTTQIGGVITSDQVSDIQNSGKAPTKDKESAIIATLDPGAYTVIINGANNATGVALVEVYDLQ